MSSVVLTISIGECSIPNVLTAMTILALKTYISVEEVE